MTKEPLSESAKTIVDAAAIQAGAVGIIGGFVPLADLAGVGAIWTKMVYDLAKDSGRELDTEFAKKLALSVTGGAALYIGGGRVLSAIISYALPGIGTVPVAGINAILDYLYTKRFGAILYKEFQSPKITGELLLANVVGMLATIFAFPGISDLTDAYGALGDIIHGGLAHAHVVASAGDAAHAAHAATHAASLVADHATHVSAADAAHHTFANAAPHFGNLTGAPVPVSTANGIMHAASATQANAVAHLASRLSAMPGHESLAAYAQSIVDGFKQSGMVDLDQLHYLMSEVLHNAPEMLREAHMIRFGGGN